jgi:hypothetical protein
MSTTKTMYIKTAKRVATLVYTLEKDSEGQYAKVGYSVCQLKEDQFTRKIGRAVALGRLEHEPLVVRYPEYANNFSARRHELLMELEGHTINGAASHLAKTLTEWYRTGCL